MESTTVSPNGAAGAAPAHSLASPAAEHILDAMLATPFAEVDPPADLPPATDIDVPAVTDIGPEMPPEGDPFPMLPPVPDTDEPSAEPPAEETDAPAAEAQPEPEAPAAAEPDAQLADEADDTDEADAPDAPPADDRPWQVGDFAVYKGKFVIEITKIFPASELGPANFSGHAIYVGNEDGTLKPGKPIVVRPLDALTPITKVGTLLRLKIGLELRSMAEYDRMAVYHAKAAEQLKAQLDAYVAAKKAIVDLIPNTAGLTW